ncbi:MAG: hypothetical protein Q9227_005089 [Pyrenula ochraceoflavens]
MGRPRKGSNREDRKQKRKKSVPTTRISSPKERLETQKPQEPSQEFVQQPQQLGSPCSDMFNTYTTNYDLPMLDSLADNSFEWADTTAFPVNLDFSFDPATLPLSPTPSHYQSPQQHSPTKPQRPAPDPLQNLHHDNFSIDQITSSHSYSMSATQPGTQAFSFNDPSKSQFMNQMKPAHSYTQPNNLPRLHTTHAHANSWGPPPTLTNTQSTTTYRTLSQILNALRLEHGQSWPSHTSHATDTRRESLFTTVSTLCDIVSTILTPHAHPGTLSSISEHPTDPTPSALLTSTAISMVLTIYRGLASSLSTHNASFSPSATRRPSSNPSHHSSPCSTSSTADAQHSPINLDSDPSCPSPTFNPHSGGTPFGGQGALANAIHLTTMDFHLARLQRVVCEADELAGSSMMGDCAREVAECRVLLHHLVEGIKGAF